MQFEKPQQFYCVNDTHDTQFSRRVFKHAERINKRNMSALTLYIYKAEKNRLSL